MESRVGHASRQNPHLEAVMTASRGLLLRAAIVAALGAVTFATPNRAAAATPGDCSAVCVANSGAITKPERTQRTWLPEAGRPRRSPVVSLRTKTLRWLRSNEFPPW